MTTIITVNSRNIGLPYDTNWIRISKAVAKLAGCKQLVLVIKHLFIQLLSDKREVIRRILLFITESRGRGRARARAKARA